MAQKLKQFEIAYEYTTQVTRVIEAPSLAEAKRRVEDIPTLHGMILAQEGDEVSSRWKVLGEVPKRFKPVWPDSILAPHHFPEDTPLPPWLTPEEEASP
jgi:hypothetical protein